MLYSSVYRSTFYTPSPAILNWQLIATVHHTVHPYIMMGNLTHISTTTHQTRTPLPLNIKILRAGEMCCLFSSLIFPVSGLWPDSESDRTVNIVQHREIRRLSFMMCVGDRLGRGIRGRVAFHHYWINRIKYFKHYWKVLYFPLLYKTFYTMCNV